MSLSKFKVSADGVVNSLSTDLKTSQVVPSGKLVKVKKFGGADPITDGTGSVIALQWGSSGNWETIRVISNGTYEFDVNRDFVGDGSKKFRLVRKNLSVTNKELFAYLEAVLKDA